MFTGQRVTRDSTKEIMPTAQFTIRTDDGECPAYLSWPSGEGPWPAVIFYGDAGGMRPAMVEMTIRLADMGFVVLLPDLYYRYGAYAPLVPSEVFAGDVMAVLGPLMATTGTDKAVRDTAAFLAFLDARDSVAGAQVGAVGFCMGGGLALAAAATHAKRFAAVASFHGGNLATDAQDSPHRLVSDLSAEVYVASAEADASFPPAMAKRLQAAMDAAGIRYRADEYAGASHGWMVPDFPTHDIDAAKRGWAALGVLLKRTLDAS